MKIIVTHTSPDWDAIGSVWILKKFLPGWGEAAVKFVPAGQLLERCNGYNGDDKDDPIEKVGEDEIIHVDTGLGPLDHHQVYDTTLSAVSRSWDYALQKALEAGEKISDDHQEAVSRITAVIVAIDHFKEVFWENPTADYHEFSLLGILEGLKLYKPDEDTYYVEFGIECLNSLLHDFENRIWAEREIADKGIVFQTRYGKAIAFETINDTVLKLSQKMGYRLVVRKDPRKGYVRIKVRPATGEHDEIDLTLLYEQLKKVDPEATWFLHVSKKMLLNGTPKNPKMIPTKLSLQKIISVIESL